MALVIQKEEQAVFQYRAADVSSIDVANQMQRSIGLARRSLSRLNEPIVGFANAAAIELVESSVEALGTTFGDQSDLAAGRTPLVDTIVRSRDAELLNRVQRDGKHGLESFAGGLFIIVHAVERHVALIAPLTVYSAASGVHCRVNIRAVRSIYDTRLQAEELDHVAGFNGQLLELNLTHRVPSAGVRRVNDGRLLS